MRRLPLIVSLSLLAAAALLAEQARPAPPRCDRPEYRQFDFWIGSWRVESPAGKLLGHNRISRELDGCILHERWAGAGGRKGESVNIWDRATERWHQSWVSDTGALLLLDGGRVGASMRLEGRSVRPDGTPVRDRITWTPIEDEGCPACVRQLWEQSDDGGATWGVAFEGIYRPEAAL